LGCPTHLISAGSARELTVLWQERFNQNPEDNQMRKDCRRLMSAGVLALSLMIGSALVTDAFARDGSRDGFVFGVGAGVSPGSSWEGKETYSVKVWHGSNDSYYFDGRPYSWEDRVRDQSWSQSGLVFEFLAGVAFSERELVALEFSSTTGDEDQKISNGLGSLAWYHYFGRQPGSFFSRVAIGRFQGSDQYDMPESGTAFQIGAGYETLSQYQVVMYFTRGEMDGPLGEYKHSGLTLSLRRLWY
jgi:hypothetical protein